MSFRSKEQAVKSARGGRNDSDAAAPARPPSAGGTGGEIVPVSAAGGASFGWPTGFVPQRPASAKPARARDGELDASGMGARAKSIFVGGGDAVGKKFEELDITAKAQASSVEALQTKYKNLALVMDLQTDSICPAGHRLKPCPHSACSNDWVCDAKDEPGGCKSFLTEPGQATGMHRFTCSICNYDLCERCQRSRSKADLQNEKARQEHKDLEVRLTWALRQKGSELQELKKEVEDIAHSGLNDSQVSLLQQEQSEQLRQQRQLFEGAMQWQDELRAEMDSLRSRADEAIRIAHRRVPALQLEDIDAEGALDDAAAGHLERSRSPTTRSLAEAVRTQHCRIDELSRHLAEQGEMCSIQQQKVHQEIEEQGRHLDGIVKSFYGATREEAGVLRSKVEELDQAAARPILPNEELVELRAEVSELRSQVVELSHSTAKQGEVGCLQEEIVRHRREVQDTMGIHGSRVDAVGAHVDRLRARSEELAARYEDEFRTIRGQVQEMSSVSKCREFSDLHQQPGSHQQKQLSDMQERAHLVDNKLAQLREEMKADLATHRTRTEETHSKIQEQFAFQLQKCHEDLRLSDAQGATSAEVAALRMRLEDVSRDVNLAKQRDMTSLPQEAALMRQQMQLQADMRSEIGTLYTRVEEVSAAVAKRSEVVSLHEQVVRNRQDWQDGLERHGNRVDSVITNMQAEVERVRAQAEQLLQSPRANAFDLNSMHEQMQQYSRLGCDFAQLQSEWEANRSRLEQAHVGIKTLRAEVEELSRANRRSELSGLQRQVGSPRQNAQGDLQQQARQLVELREETQADFAMHCSHLEEARGEIKSLHAQVAELSRGGIEVADFKRQATSLQQKVQSNTQDHAQRIDRALAQLRSETRADFDSHRSHVEQVQIKLEQQLESHQQHLQENAMQLKRPASAGPAAVTARVDEVLRGAAKQSDLNALHQEIKSAQQAQDQIMCQYGRRLDGAISRLQAELGAATGRLDGLAKSVDRWQYLEMNQQSLQDEVRRVRQEVVVEHAADSASAGAADCRIKMLNDQVLSVAKRIEPLEDRGREADQLMRHIRTRVDGQRGQAPHGCEVGCVANLHAVTVDKIVDCLIGITAHIESAELKQLCAS